MDANGINTQAMDATLAQMIKARRDPGFVVFLTRIGNPVAMPMFGRPSGTREEAIERARQALAVGGVRQAWTVGRDGIQRVAQ